MWLLLSCSCLELELCCPHPSVTNTAEINSFSWQEARSNADKITSSAMPKHFSTRIVPFIIFGITRKSRWLGTPIMLLPQSVTVTGAEATVAFVKATSQSQSMQPSNSYYAASILISFHSLQNVSFEFKWTLKKLVKVKGWGTNILQHQNREAFVVDLQSMFLLLCMIFGRILPSRKGGGRRVSLVGI